MFLQKRSRVLVFPAKIQRRHDAPGHHFRIAHLALHVFAMVQGQQQIGAQAVYEYNVYFHEFSPWFSAWLKHLYCTGKLMAFPTCYTHLSKVTT